MPLLSARCFTYTNLVKIRIKKNTPHVISAKFNHSLVVPFRVFEYIFFAFGIKKTSIATKSAAVPIFRASSIYHFPRLPGSSLRPARKLI